MTMFMVLYYRDSVTSRVHPVHLTYADQRQMATNPQTMPTDLPGLRVRL